MLDFFSASVRSTSVRAIVRICVADKIVQLSVHRRGAGAATEEALVSFRLVQGRWEVRWRDATGSHRSKRFHSEESAKEFDQSIHDHEVAERRQGQHGNGGGVYPYKTASGTMWRCSIKRSDGSFTSKRGFTNKKAAQDARRRLTEKQERGEVRHTKETFGAFWSRWLDSRRPYLEAGTWAAYERDGRLRLVPALGAVPLGRLDVDHVRDLMDQWTEAMEAEELAPKTINNTLGTLLVCLNTAVEDGLMATNPTLRVPRLPPAHIEREYLRLHEIPLYSDSCSDIYRPLAELLIGSGLRISEALALRISDLELEKSGGLIVVYRSRKKKQTVGSTKSDRFRSVEIGRGLSRVLRDHIARRGEMASDKQHEAHLFVMPVRVGVHDRGRWDGYGAGEPMDRRTVSRGWHKAALQDAGLRDMPLHSLRHTAAAAWLAAGNSLMYVQRQLGHSNIGTTEQYYGYLERHVLAAGALATEEAIARAARRVS
jgi:integrase